MRVATGIAKWKIRDIAKCHRNAIPVWAGWLNGRVVGVVIRRSSDPNYSHQCYGVLVLSSQMTWSAAITAICQYLGCNKDALPISLRGPLLRGEIARDIVLVRRICEILYHAVSERKESQHDH
jgi:hypothetical protein